MSMSERAKGGDAGGCDAVAVGGLADGLCDDGWLGVRLVLVGNALDLLVEQVVVHAVRHRQEQVALLDAPLELLQAAAENGRRGVHSRRGCPADCPGEGAELHRHVREARLHHDPAPVEDEELAEPVPTQQQRHRVAPGRHVEVVDVDPRIPHHGHHNHGAGASLALPQGPLAPHMQQDVDGAVLSPATDGVQRGDLPNAAHQPSGEQTGREAVTRLDVRHSVSDGDDAGLVVVARGVLSAAIFAVKGNEAFRGGKRLGRPSEGVPGRWGGGRW
mmetsp:Transcript_21049/g.60099  ORF Transcript_21049/g.60099 Transcript_21049/m.60099 type:complete len:274 (-) Transcript_21049:346-1167(-)